MTTDEEIPAAVVFGEGLRRERAGRRLTQSEAAALVGFARSTWGEIEAGKRGVSLDDAAVICAALGVPLRALLPGERGAEIARVLGLDE